MLEQISHNQDRLEGLTPSQALSCLAAEQAEETRQKLALAAPLDCADTFFEAYKVSPEFKKMYGEAVRTYAHPHYEAVLKLIEREMVGRVFQDMGFWYFRTQTHNGQVLLSEGKTAMFFDVLYPNLKNSNHRFGLGSKYGVGIPDGLLLDRDEIIGYCEYSLRATLQYGEKKLALLEQKRYEFPGLFTDKTQLIFVTPQHSYLIQRLAQRARFLTTPFNYGEFKSFINKTYYSYRVNENSATLDEVQKEALFQQDRVMQKLKSGELTEEDCQYLLKHRLN